MAECERAGCAALAFHKAIIGLTQLDALEVISGQLSNLYSPRSIYTYYSLLSFLCMHANSA